MNAALEEILPHREPFLLIDEVLEVTPGVGAVARKTVRADEWYLQGHFPGRPIMPGVLIVEALAQTGALAVLSEEENRGKLAFFAGIDDCRFKRVVEPGDVLELRCELDRVRGPIGRGKAEARVGGELACKATLERRIAAPEEALTDLALPAARAALAQAGVEASDVDLLICATVTPDMMFPTSSALLADELGAPDAAAYDLLAGCTGFMYALVQAYGMMAAGLAERALVVGGDVLSRILDWTDRSTLILFGDGAGAVVLERTSQRGFLGFELGADGGGGIHLSLPGSGSRKLEDAVGNGYVHMNGREVFKFATRVLVSSAEAVLGRCGVAVEDVDVYVPHQANVRIMDHAAQRLGIPRERMVVNVDRYGNTSSGSIPLALADAQRDGRLKKGDLVLMTGMGAGLTWGSGLMEWTL